MSRLLAARAPPAVHRTAPSGPFSLQFASCNPILCFRSACPLAPVVIRPPQPPRHVEAIPLSHFTCDCFQPDQRVSVPSVGT